jgi:hypothetical protein
MGLDIAYFTNAQPIELPQDVEDLSSWIHSNHAVQYYTLEGLEARLEGFPAGWLTATFAGGFRAGSYSGYGAWRNLLAQTILRVPSSDVWRSRRQFKGKPFVELIDFADNEGCIGPVVSAKLAKDFAQRRNTFAKGPLVSEYDLARYDSWAEAFAAAAEGNGFVLFH